MASIFSCALKINNQRHNKYIHQNRLSLRKIINNFVKVPEIPKRKKCNGFTYCSAKIFNTLPKNIRETSSEGLNM